MTRAELLAAAKPILLNSEMVQACLEERKSVTRRIVKKKYENTCLEMFTNKYGTRLVERQNDAPPDEEIIMPDGQKGTRRHLVAMREIPEPYHPGDILWVRETFSPVGVQPIRYLYKCFCPEAEGLPVRWRPSIHMPKEAARLFLRVKSVRVERLQDIITGDYKTPINIKAEGIYIPCLNCTHYNGECKDFIADGTCKLVGKFKNLWNSTIEPAKLPLYGWDANPWVWVIELERVVADD